MNKIAVHLITGETIIVGSYDFNRFLENINNFKGNTCLFISFDDYVFPINNIAYIDKVKEEVTNE